MAPFEAVIFGIIQGLTEFFTVSSSGHLVVFQSLFGIREPQLAFDIFLHLGTLMSVLIYFRHDIYWLFGRDRHTLACILAASVPTFIIGFLSGDAVEKLFGMPDAVGYMMALTGAFLIISSVYQSRRRGGAEKKLGIFNSLVIGISQGIAIIPGISRSGATISTCIIAGLNAHTATRFSFLLSIPAIAGATLFKSAKIGSSILSGDAVSFISGAAAAMTVGLFSIDVLFRVIKDNKLYIFGIYCILAGSAVIILI